MSAVANAVRVPTSTNDKLKDDENSKINAKAQALARLVENKPLPIFKETLQQIGKFYDKPNSSIPKIIEALRLDPGYSFQIFCKTNAGLIKHKRKPASSLQHAVLVLGIPQVIAIGKPLPLISDIKNSAAKSWIYQIICRSYHAGVQARELVADLDQNSRDVAFISAQLRDAYLLRLWLHAPNEMTELMQTSSQQSLFAQEGILTHVGKIISNKENFSASIQKSFLPQTDSSRLVKTIAYANHLSQLTETGWYSHAMKDLVFRSSFSLGLSEETLSQQSHKSAIIAAHESNFYPVKPAACRLVDIESIQKTIIEKLKTIENKVPSIPQEKVKPKQEHIKPSRSEKVVSDNTETDLNTAMRKLMLLSKNKHSPQEILEFGFKLLLKKMEKKPIAFFLLDKNKVFLKSRFTANFDDKKKSIILPLRQKSIFKVLMQKQQSILLDDKNREKLSNLLMMDLPLKVRERDFAAISVFIQNKPIGLFYLESNENKPLSKNINQQFITICKATISSLEEVKKHV